jgi:hypothetical protein
VEIMRHVVHPHKVEAINSKPPQTVLDRSQRALLRVIESDAVRAAEPEETALVAEIGSTRLPLVQNDVAHLGTQSVFVAISWPEPSASISQFINRFAFSFSSARKPAPRTGRWRRSGTGSVTRVWGLASTQGCGGRSHTAISTDGQRPVSLTGAASRQGVNFQPPSRHWSCSACSPVLHSSW